MRHLELKLTFFTIHMCYNLFKVYNLFTILIPITCPLSAYIMCRHVQTVCLFLTIIPGLANQLKGRRLERRWKASNAETDRLSYRAAGSSTNKLINKSRAASNVECINEASKNPRRLWSTIKSLLHSSPPSEQLSPSISQPLANSLATFFCNKIVALKESISLKLRGSPSPFDFDQPHSNELLSDFTPVTPAEVSKLLQSWITKMIYQSLRH